jgi:gluconolactonase
MVFRIPPRVWALLGVLLTTPVFSAPAQSKRPFQPGLERLDVEFDRLIAPGTPVEKLAAGFSWSEGPVWTGGGLVFSDVPENTMYRWQEGQSAAEVFLKPSGTLPGKPPAGRQGSNGLAVDASGNLLICQHGERRLVRLGADGNQVALATHFEGKRLNSPNDLALRGNGDVYFTDPPYGLEGGNKSPAKELGFNGVFRLTPQGQLEALVRDLSFPNGIAFSPDERVLYVCVSDPKGCRLMAYEVAGDGSLRGGRVFFDGQPLVEAGRPGLFDGLKVGQDGHLFVTGPGGVLVLSAAGKHLGTILTGVPTGNCAWGGEGETLYMTADATLCRIRTLTRGAGWGRR